MVVGKLSAKSFRVAILHWKTYSLESRGGRFHLIFFVLANEKKIDLCRLKNPLSKDETRRDGSNPFIIISSLNHYSFCETMSQVLLSWTPLTEFNVYSTVHNSKYGS